MSTANGHDQTSGTPTGGGFVSASATTEVEAAPGAEDSSQAEQVPASGDNPPVDENTVPEAFRSEDGTLAADKAIQYYSDIEALAAERVQKFGAVPDGDYDLTGIQDAEGQALEIDSDNPFLKGVLPAMKEAGIGQKLASQLVTAYAQSTVADVERAVEAVRTQQAKATTDEFASLGDQGPARLQSMLATLSNKPEDGEALMSKDEANQLVDQIRTKDGFELLERLIERGFGSAEGRVPANAGGTDERSRAERVFGSRGN